MIIVEGKNGIRASIVADSISPAGVRLTTFEIEYPRIILSEYNTHRMLSKNSASSRAIPFAKMQQQLTGKPVRFGAANKGMQDKGEDHTDMVDVGEVLGFSHPVLVTPDAAWDMHKKFSSGFAEAFYKAGYHKQIFNRLTEAHQMMKTVVSGTEFENFFWLRDDDAADPTIHELARCMREAREQSVPFLLEAGQWHLPYVDWVTLNGEPMWKDEYGTYVRATWDELIKISCARSAAVSFRNVDYGLERCLEVYERLVGDQKKHGSAMEHAATPMQREVMYIDKDNFLNMPQFPTTWEDGITHMDKKKRLWSGNFRGWIQHRKLIPGENYEGE